MNGAAVGQVATSWLTTIHNTLVPSLRTSLRARGCILLGDQSRSLLIALGVRPDAGLSRHCRASASAELVHLFLESL